MADLENYPSNPGTPVPRPQIEQAIGSWRSFAGGAALSVGSGVAGVFAGSFLPLLFEKVNNQAIQVSSTVTMAILIYFGPMLTWMVARFIIRSKWTRRFRSGYLSGAGLFYLSLIVLHFCLFGGVH